MCAVQSKSAEAINVSYLAQLEFSIPKGATTLIYRVNRSAASARLRPSPGPTGTAPPGEAAPGGETHAP